MAVKIFYCLFLFLTSSSEKILIEFNQPYENHNGGSLVFGKDGYLYIAVGDVGAGGDPQNYAQILKSLLGKILRIDVNNGDPYSIPSDNPFKGNTAGNKEEIFAWGMRNPWKITVDRETGKIWAGMSDSRIMRKSI
jgi:glucose/arabinose dehydrogenase